MSYPCRQLLTIMRQGFMLLLLLHLSLALSAHDIVYKQFSTSNGLPGSEIYDLHQDKKGFLWFATDKGLCRYDGHKFRIYTTHDGLSENVVFSIHEDKNGILWFASFTKGVCCWNGNNFYTPAFNAELLKNLRGNAWVRNIVFDKSNNAWLSLKNADKANRVYRADSSGLKVISLEQDSAVGFVMNIDAALLEGSNFNPRFGASRVEKSSKGFKLYLKSNDLKSAIHLSDSRIAVASDQEILVFDKSGLLWSYTLNSSANSIYTDDARRIWVASSDGVYLLEPGTPKPLAHYFDGSNISSVLKDSEGSFWFATLDAGAYMVPAFNVRLLQIPAASSRQKINTLLGNGEELFFSSFDGKLYRAGKNFNVSEIRYATKTSYIHSLAIDNKELLISNGNKLQLRNGKVEPWMNNAIKSMQVLKNGRRVIGYINGFSVYENEKEVYHSKDSGFNLRVTSTCEDDKGNIWIGTLYGLYRASPNPSQIYRIEKLLLDKRVNYLVFSQGKLVAGTSEDGVYCFEKGKLIHHIEESDGLAGNFISHIYIQGRDSFWLSTHKGISRVIFDKKGYQLSNISRDDGLPANEVNAICFLNGYVYAATDMGIAAFETGKLLRLTKTYPVYIDRIRINESDTSIHDEYSLSYDQRNISVSYAGLSLRYPAKLLYFYKLEGMNQDWVPTRERNLQFANLPPGDYKLRLQAASIDNPLLRGPEQLLSFSIAPHFTQSTWFLALIAFTSITVILLLIYQYLRIQQQKVRNKEELILAEQKALRAQMNPHFIFNAMNSIQHYVYENNRASAGIFLSKFASLMRVILENSGHSMISLEEELSCVRQYLELERIRFANRFNFDIEVDADISLSDTKIPSMMIQPFLENAIWHGIMPRQSEGALNFRISKKDDYIYCCIDDNGIGRRLAEALKDSRSMHKSSALKNIRERINLINSVYKMDMKLLIDDKEDESFESSGTRVTLSYKIPGYEQN